MTPYIVFFSLAGIPALFYSRKPNVMLWAVVWLLFVLFIGLRHQVGGDWAGYLLITDQINKQSLGDAVHSQEFLFGLITWLSTRMHWGVYGANVLGAIVFCTGLFSFCARLPNRWLALAAATPFLVIVAVMSANRQGMAIGIILFLMARWPNAGLIKRSAGILIAGLFHTSALLLLVLSVLDLNISRTKKVFLIAVMTAIVFWLVSRSEESWYRYTTVYVDQSYGAYSPGAIFHLLLNLVPAIVMLASRKRWARLCENWPMLRQLCWMAVALMTLSPFFTVAVGRMSLYLFPISITFFAYAPAFAKGADGRAMIRTLSVIGLGCVLALWLQFANTAFAYRPYKNVLLLNSWELELPG